jgi:AcrR family transcriptional regulator
MKEIADEAGVSKALIHYHFESKETVLLETERMLYRTLSKEVMAISLTREPCLETALSALDSLAEAMVRFAPLTPVLVELGAIALRSEKLAVRMQRLQVEAFALIEAGLMQTLGPDVDRLIVPVERLASLLLSCLYGIALGALYRPDARPTQQLDDLKTLLRDSLLSNSLVRIPVTTQDVTEKEERR